MDAIRSVEQCPDKSLCEIVIVNDGSTDDETLKVLNSLEANNYKIIHQENKGPAAARNKGVQCSASDFILFLDSDNKIRNEYISRAIHIFHNHPGVDIVYGNPSFFGEGSIPRFNSGPFDLKRIMVGNYIDMCAIIRRSLWEELGGLDEHPDVIGHEDWEFWIRAGLSDAKFYYIDEILFDYRLVSDSLVKSAIRPDRYQKMVSYVYSKHLTGLLTCYRSLYNQYSFYQNDMMHPVRSFFKFFYRKYFGGSARA